MSTFTELRQTFRAYFDKVKLIHDSVSQKNYGHGFDHDITVAALALTIAPDQHTAKKAWCAALLHSMDRLHEKTEREAIIQIMNDVIHFLPTDYFSQIEIQEIIEAAIRHDELNRSDQSLTQQVLMDADRLANLMLSVVMRAGQFRPHIPVLEFSYLDNLNPESTYKKPCSVFDNLREILNSFVPQLRLEKAKFKAELYVQALEQYIKTSSGQYKELNLENLDL